MCGRYTDTKRLQGDLAFVPRYNIAPTQEASIVARIPILSVKGVPSQCAHECDQIGFFGGTQLGFKNYVEELDRVFKGEKATIMQVRR